MHKRLQEINQLVSISQTSRRQLILEEMALLENNQINCFKCLGPCCTYVSNSMQITLLEAIDIINFLNDKQRLNNNLMIQLQENIEHFRLDKVIGFGKNSLRKTYTCPFFENHSKGCSISRNAKPIGCLGFNPVEKNITNGGSCKSNPALLEIRDFENQKEEAEVNACLKETLKIFWDKAPIPVAVLEVLLALEKA